MYLDEAARLRGNQLFAVPGAVPLRVARTRSATDGRNVVALVRGLIFAGNAPAAVRSADAFRQKFGGAADAKALAGDAHRVNGNSGRALGLYREAQAIRTTWPLVLRIAAAEQASGNHAALEPLFAQALAGDPHNAAAAAQLAGLAMERGHWERAALLLDQALDHGGGRDPSLWVMRSFVARQMQDDELAYDAAVFAYALQPMSPEATALLASLLGEYEQGDVASGLASKLTLLRR